MKRILVFAVGAFVAAGISYLAGDALAQSKKAAYQGSRTSPPNQFNAAQPGAQNAAPAVMPARIALLDLGRIFKEYKKFNVLADTLKADAKDREQTLVQFQNQMKRLVDERKTRKPDSPDFQALEKELAKTKAEMEYTRDSAQREFIRREAELYHTIYQEAIAEVNRLAHQHQLTLVLRFSSDEITAGDPQDVIKGINRWVLYSDPGMDLTQTVLNALNARYRG